jgi:hypothetical protein
LDSVQLGPSHNMKLRKNQQYAMKMANISIKDGTSPHEKFLAHCHQ